VDKCADNSHFFTMFINSTMKEGDLKEQCMKLHIALSFGDSCNTNTMDLFYDCMMLWEIISEDQGCTNPRCLVPRLTKLCMMATNIFHIITALSFLTRKNVYYYTCTKQKVPESTEPWVTPKLCVLSMKFATCQPSGTWNLEVAPRFLGSLWTPAEDTDRAAQVLQQRLS